MDDCMPNDMREAIAQFEKETDEIITGFCQKLDEISPPDFIYHYTNDVGLQGILESGKLWFTNIFNLNDPSELRHGCQPIINILKTTTKGAPTELNIFSKKLSDDLNELVERIAHLYIFSFSHNGDDLGQWRAYGDNGRGFALKFDCRTLEQAFINNGPDRNCTFPIKYEENSLREMSKKVIDQLTSYILLMQGKNLKDEVFDNYLTQLYDFLYVTALRLALFFKHKAYVNECEFRFFHLHRDDALENIKYRSRSHSLIQYKEFDWKSNSSSALKEIIIGPAANKVGAEQFARNCLQKFYRENENIPINLSIIPYRI